MKKIIILSLAVAMIMTGCSLGGTKNISIDEAKVKALDFINKNLMQPGSEASIKEVVEESGLYKVTINLPDGQEIATAITKDGTKFFTQILDIAELEEKNKDKDAQADGANAQATQNVPKAEVAKAELFVMSFCPYGVVAETAMAPVYELLGDVADININFISSIQGDDINQVKSLHGPIEGIENARQLCVAENYGKDVLWDYVQEINEKCYPIYRNGEDAYKTCWQTAAKNAGTNTSKLDTCVADKGPDFIRTEDALAKSYGVSGSPSLIINGVKANAARTPEGYKTAICNAFEEQPEECETVLSGEGGTASGDCN